MTDRDDMAAATAVRMLTSVANKDGAGACVALAPDTAADLEESAGKPWAEAMLDEDLPEPGTVSASHVYGQWAQVRLTGDTMFLGVFGDGWRVVAAGRTARGDRPYDCVIQRG